jgi:hypothetical protein
MKRIIFISIYILGSIAAKGHEMSPDAISGEKKQTVIEYVSLGNDFAEIKMEMYDNGKFTIRIYPKEDGKSLKLKGRWEKKSNFYLLEFKRTQVAVNKLFNMNDPNVFEVVNEMNVRFSEHLSNLWIWGIQCKKLDLETA